MNERTVSRIEGWDSRPYSGGYASLREFADGGFTGALRSGGTWLFMLNGRVVGVHEGTIEDFEDAEGVAYQAPHPSLPLLFTMLEEGGEQQAKYYTNDTPVSEAHRQLSDASFTGYIELSENVLSGDYYVLYYGGRSMSCAFVGNSERLVAGDEAFELADDEVGIYEVRTVDIDVVDIPDSTGAPSSESTDGTVDTVESDSTTEATESAREATEPESGREITGDEAEPDPTGEADEPSGASAERADGQADVAKRDASATGDVAERDASAARTQSEPGAVETPRVDSDPTAPGEVDAATADEREVSPAENAGSPETDSTDATQRASTTTKETSEASTVDASTEGPAEPTSSEPAPSEPTSTVKSTHERVGSRTGRSTTPSRTASTRARSKSATDRGVLKSQVGDIELRAIPSLSPDHTIVAEPGAETAVEDVAGGNNGSSASTGTGRGAGGRSRISGGASEGTKSGGTRQGETDTASAGSDAGAATGTASVSAGSTRPPSGPGGSQTGVASGAEVPDPGSVPDDVDELRHELQVRQERIGELEAALADLRVQRDGLTDDRDRLQSEVSRLESEVDELQEEIDRLRSRLNEGSKGKKRLSPEQALEGTNLFVRYGSKSGGTLENAHAGEVEREEVNENLRVEHHTQFDADGVVIDGDDFETFLSESIYRTFVEWVVRELLYEIRETGHAKGLRELYDAIPQIDRAELLGEVSVQFSEDGEQYREQRSFDVVIRDRMGNPLIVANLNDSRNPADREMMETILTHAGDIETSNESLSSAIMVTSSFFQPGALEAAEEAVGGGLLSRDSKESYVKTARKSGYHLILVESRGGEFHVNVPEL